MKPHVEPPEPELAVRIPAGAVELQGDLSVPEGATGVVLFAHGSGNSRYCRITGTEG